MSKREYFIANIPMLEEAIGFTGKSNAHIASTAGVSAVTLKNALLGKGLMKSKAYSIVKALNELDVKPEMKFELLFDKIIK